MYNKILSTISLCKRAGKLTLGFDVVKEAIQSKEAKIVVIANDISAKTKKEVLLMAEKGMVEVVEIPFSMDEVWQSVNKRAGVLAITDKGFSDKLCGLLQNNNKED